MKKLISLGLLSLLASGRSGYCTANAKSAGTADAVENAALGKPPEGETNEQRIERLEATVLALRDAAVVPIHVATGFSSTDALIKGAGVDAENVNWRIRAGLSAAQAVEVAVMEKTEADAAAAASSKKGAK